MKPAIAPPLLPYPSGNTVNSLQQFDADLRRALVDVLTAYAFRINGSLPKDGSEPAAMVHIEAASFGDVTPTSYATDPFHIGNQTGANVAIDENEIMARNNGAVSSLNLNADGAEVIIGVNAVSPGTGLRLSSGQVKFPATQQASADANTLDDFIQSTWTPVLTYATPGDLSVAYSVQFGRYQKVGNRVHVDFVVSTSTHTFTTASGELRITGLPYAAANLSGSDWTGTLQWQGITTTRTDMASSITSAQSHIRFVASGSGLSRDSMDATTNTTSGTQIVLMGHVEYEAAN